MLGTVVCSLSIDLNASFKVSWFFCNFSKLRVLEIYKLSLVTCTVLKSSFEASLIITKQIANRNKITVLKHIINDIDETSLAVVDFARWVQSSTVNIEEISLNLLLKNYNATAKL